MTVAVQTIVTKLSDQILNDSNNTRWPEAELVSWVNEAQSYIATATDAYVETVEVTLTADQAIQDCPADTIRIIDIIGAYDNGSPNIVYPIRRTQKFLASTLAPLTGYGTAASVPVVKEWHYDEASPRTFEVTPLPTSAARLTMLHAATPPIVVLGGNISLPDQYEHVIVDYVAFRAFSKDTEDVSPDLGRATAYYNSVLQNLGMNAAGDMENEPRKVEP